MSEPDFLTPARVAILGLGLMGGSLALALRGHCAAVWGVDPDPLARQLASERQAVDRVSADPAEALPQADLVVLAAPVGAILALLRDLPGLHPGSPVVLDLGSTKAEVVRAMAGLPERFDPLGGHPMCGKEKASLEYADPALFRDAPFAFTPLPRTRPRARLLADQLARFLGARPLWLDAETHDRWTAATSHAPYLLASALSAATPGESAPLVGPGFRSTARLAAASPGMMLDILVTNRQQVLEAVGRFRRSLDALEAHLAQGDWEALERLLAQGAGRYTDLTGPTPHGDEP